jgi:hypothetical protein
VKFSGYIDEPGLDNVVLLGPPPAGMTIVIR